MQSWGAEAKFDRRTTERTPTKSGVTGLIAAALGRKRNDSIEDLAALRFGTRSDRSGILMRDYHTAKSKRSAYVTNRYYLADAVFLVGLEGDTAILREIEAALREPAYPLFLGRRSCPPEGRVLLGIREGVSLEDALRNEPLLVPDTKTDTAGSQRMRIVVETDDSVRQVYFLRDAPVSFDQEHRVFGFRRVSEYTAPCKERQMPVKPTEHDPMTELEG